MIDLGKIEKYCDGATEIKKFPDDKSQWNQKIVDLYEYFSILNRALFELKKEKLNKSNGNAKELKEYISMVKDSLSGLKAGKEMLNMAIKRESDELLGKKPITHQKFEVPDFQKDIDEKIRLEDEPKEMFDDDEPIIL